MWRLLLGTMGVKSLVQGLNAAATAGFEPRTVWSEVRRRNRLFSAAILFLWLTLRWLAQHGLAARRLTILDALRPTVIHHQSKYVPILDKHVTSKVYDQVMCNAVSIIVQKANKVTLKVGLAQNWPWFQHLLEKQQSCSSGWVDLLFLLASLPILTAFHWRWGSPSKCLTTSPNIDNHSCPFCNKNCILLCRSNHVCYLSSGF